jgi:haloacetate dehalogenase
MTHSLRHRVPPRLAARFTVVTADPRGCAGSIGPEDAGEGSGNDSVRAIALDMVALVASLGFSRVQVAGHDRGARTARRMAPDHPGRVLRAAVPGIRPAAAAVIPRGGRRARQGPSHA